MKQYNVEVFEGFKYKCSAQVSEIEYKEDYLSPEKNKIKTSQNGFTAEKMNYIHIKGEEINVIGIVSQYQEDEKARQVTYESFLTLFDADIFWGGIEERTIENFIAGRIGDNFIRSDDAEQNINGLELQVLTGTQGSLALEEGIYNLLEDIIIPAFKEFRIIVSPVWDIHNRRIVLQIAQCQKRTKTIEADLPNIFSKNIVLRKTKADLNKVVVINEEDSEEVVVVYRTNKNEITTENKDRIVPVSFGTIKVKASNKKTFPEVALEKAKSKLRKSEYENLIELEMMRNDSLVHPEEIELGQVVSIISAGISYTSILTGKEIGKKETLIFGTVRLDLTKVIRRIS